MGGHYSPNKDWENLSQKLTGLIEIFVGKWVGDVVIIIVSYVIFLGTKRDKSLDNSRRQHTTDTPDTGSDV